MKKIGLIVLTLCMFLMPTLTNQVSVVYAAPEDVAGKKQLVSASGIVQSGIVLSKSCGFLEEFGGQIKKDIAEGKKITDSYKREDAGWTDISAIFNNMFMDFGFTLVEGLVAAAGSAGSTQDCHQTTTEIAKDKSNDTASSEANESFLRTIFNQTQVFTQLSNITNNGSLMSLIGIAQWTSLLLMMFLILYKGFRAFSGDSIDPVNLIIRFSVAATMIYSAPYILQDILAINNLLVHNISSMTVTVEGYKMKISEVLPASIIIVLMQMQGLMMENFKAVSGEENAEDIQAGTAASGALLMIIAVIGILIAIMIPFFKLIVWWYTRYFKIFVMAVISPFMFMTFADSATDKTGYNFLKNFSVTAFEQMLMMFGIALTGVFISSAMPLMNAMGLGFIGYGIALFAAVSFLATLPDTLGTWIQGNPATPSASNTMSAMQSTGKTTRKVTGANAAVKATKTRAKEQNKIRKANGVERKAFKSTDKTLQRMERGGDIAATQARASIRKDRVSGAVLGKDGTKKYKEAIKQTESTNIFDKTSRDDSYSARAVNKKMKQNIRNVKNTQKENTTNNDSRRGRQNTNKNKEK
jgi:hypothetical protein